MVPDPIQCDRCGSQVASDAALGVCPHCLLRTAIEYGAGQALAPLLPKLRYFCDYELLDEVARGGMGVVYRARQMSLDRIVAVKMMRPGLLATDAEIRRSRQRLRPPPACSIPISWLFMRWGNSTASITFPWISSRDQALRR
jgi:serine/threonine protein kinase